METGKKEETEQARDWESPAEPNQTKFEIPTPNRVVERKEEKRDNGSNKSPNRIQETGPKKPQIPTKGKEGRWELAGVGEIEELWREVWEERGNMNLGTLH